MWVTLLLSLMPAKYRLMLMVGERMFGRLNSTEEMVEAAEGFVAMFNDDGYASPPELTKWASKVGLLGRPKERRNRRGGKRGTQPQSQTKAG